MMGPYKGTIEAAAAAAPESPSVGAGTCGVWPVPQPREDDRAARG